MSIFNPTTWFQKRPKIIAYFIDETGHVFKKKVKYDNNVFYIRYAGNKMMYIVNHERVLYDARSNKGVSYYYLNNPEPIKFQHMRNKELDSVGFKKIIDSKAIIDLFSEEGAKKMMIIIILLVVVIILCILILGFEGGFIHYNAANATAVPG